MLTMNVGQVCGIYVSDQREEARKTETGGSNRCTNDRVYKLSVRTTANLYSRDNVCNYPDPGSYTAALTVQRQGQSTLYNTLPVVVNTPTPTPLASATLVYNEENRLWKVGQPPGDDVYLL